jgi:hypothetical protein
MPNWDAFKGLMKKNAFEDFPIYFTTPYFNTKTDNYSKILTDAYAKKLKGKPSDMAFKGFECAHYLPGCWQNTLLILSNISMIKSYKIFTDYNSARDAE